MQARFKMAKGIASGFCLACLLCFVGWATKFINPDFCDEFLCGDGFSRTLEHLMSDSALTTSGVALRYSDALEVFFFRRDTALGGNPASCTPSQATLKREPLSSLLNRRDRHQLKPEHIWPRILRIWLGTTRLVLRIYAQVPRRRMRFPHQTSKQ